MIKLEEMYEKIPISLDYNLINQIINLYFSIPYEEVKRKEITDSLYSRINKEDITDTINQNDMNMVFKKINEDFKKADYPYESNPVTIQTGWNTFQSWNLLGTAEINILDISHRLYIGVKPSDLYDFINKLYDKFKSSQIPFYFKADSEPNIVRKDKVVVYTSTSLLEKTVNIVLDVLEENKEIESRCCNSSILVGKITDKIGYASEDVTLKTSYTDLICNIFSSSFEISVEKYLNENPNKEAMFKNKRIYIKDYYSNMDYLEKRLKTRILMYVFLNNYEDYKDVFLNTLTFEFDKNGLDVNNICLNKKTKTEFEMIIKI